MNRSVRGTYTETYDLNTAIGEMSILGIHTPQADSLKKMFKGFFEQYRKYRILGCNLKMVCATQQSLTPDQVGLEAGVVDPRDILNPILFKACTGDNINVLLNQVYNQNEEIVPDGHSSILSGSVSQHIDSRPLALSSYYELMADETFRKEHPQRGLLVTGLRPMVHKVVTTQPFKWNGAFALNGSAPQVPGARSPNYAASSPSPIGFGGISGTNVDPDTYAQTIVQDANVNPSVFVSDGVTQMPWLETTFQDAHFGLHEESETKRFLGEYLISDVPRVYCGVIVLPPAILQRLFWRMQIVWFVEFKDFRPACEVGPIDAHEYSAGALSDGLQGLSPPSDGSNYRTYFNLYHTATPDALNKSFSSFDASGLAEVDVVNEKVQ